MNFLRNSLKKRKGFTLVECLIALTVFAALTLVVFAILANARQRSVLANTTEENLNILIDNVVSDESYVSYNDNSSKQLTLKLSNGGADFKISYSEIDGYKNFVLCPNANCQYFAENTAFMTVEGEDFTQINYVCPKCDATIEQQLVCESCNNTGSHLAHVNKFTYMPDTCGYYCNECGSVNVRGANIGADVVSNNNLNIKGLVPNAILCGDIEPYGDPEYLFDIYSFIDGDGNPVTSPVNGISPAEVESDITYSLKFKEGVSNSDPGIYTLTVKPNAADSGCRLMRVVVKLPKGYNVSWYNEVNGTCIPSNSSNTLSFNVMNTQEAKVEFSLTNEISSTPFELDYGNNSDSSQDGLLGVWFLENVTYTTENDAAGRTRDIKLFNPKTINVPVGS